MGSSTTSVIQPARRFAVIIANWEYQYFTSLRGVERDCDDLLAVLKQPQAGFSQVLPLRNKTRSEALDAIRQLAEGLRPGDLLLLYFIGHGDDTHEHVLLFPKADRNGLKYGEEAVQVRYLVDLVLRWKLHATLVLDACRENRDLTQSIEGKGLKALPDLTRDIAVAERGAGEAAAAAATPAGSLSILMACGPNMLAHEIPDPHAGYRGLFSWAFVEHLHEQLRDGHHVLFDQELRDGVREQMRRLAAAHKLEGNQEPELRGSVSVTLIPGKPRFTAPAATVSPQAPAVAPAAPAAFGPAAPVNPAPSPQQTAADLASRLLRERDHKFAQVKSAAEDLLRLGEWHRSVQHCAALIEHAKQLIQLKPGEPWIDQLLDLLWTRAPWSLMDRGDSYERVADLSGGHADFYAAHFSPDGKRVCLSGEAPAVLIHDVGSPNAAPRRIAGHQAFVRAARFSPDGSLLLTASADGTARVTAVEDEQVLRVFPQPMRALCADWSPDGESILVGGDDGNLLVWSLSEHGPPKRLQGHRGKVICCRFSADGCAIASAGEDGVVRIWNGGGEALFESKAHKSAIFGLAIGASGSVFLSAAEDGVVRAFGSHGKAPSAKLAEHGDAALCTDLFPGERLAASASADGKVIVWDLQQGRSLFSFQAAGDWVRAVAISPDGCHIVSCGDGRHASLWRVRARKPAITRQQLVALARRDVEAKAATSQRH
jgi:WD40 repeat protein